MNIPRDKISNEHQGFGFVEFRTEEDADYAIKIMHMIKLYGKPIRLHKAANDSKIMDVGANIFIGNLDDEVDEKMLYDVFSSFGLIISTKINKNSEKSKRSAVICFDNFDSSDQAI